MGFSKFATFDSAEILDVKGAPTRQRTASLDKIADYHDYRTEDGYLYARIRAISSRVNKNNDGWPSIELAGSPEIFERHQSSQGGFTVEASEGRDMGFATFVGKPIFVDHHNSDPEHTRGAIVDAKLHVEDAKTAGKLDPYYASAPDNHTPPTWVELLLEIDAKSYPKFAKAIIDGSKDFKKGIDGFSMGCFVPGTPITLDDGTQKNIEDIEVEDKVLTHKGNIEPVTYTMTRHYDGTVYEVHSYGQSVPMTLTEEHPVWTKNGWTEAKHLQIGNMVLTPTFKTGEAIPNTPWARLIGFYLAEGNLGYDKKRYPDGRPVFVEWNFDANKEPHLVEQVKRDLVSIGYKSCGPYVKNNCATVRCNSPQLAASFLANAGQHSWEKKLTSDIVTFWNKQDQKAILDSYFQGDANRLNEHRVEIGTASKDLAHQVQAMATRVGYKITPPVKQHSPSAAHKRAKYSLQGILDGQYHHKNASFLDEHGLWRKITKIIPSDYSGPVYNFDVDGDDSYVAADIAVHNCDVKHTICNICSNKAEAPDDFCEHVKLKGASFKDKKTGKMKKAYEDCYGIKFFEISGVFEPADETALIREVKSSLVKEAPGHDHLPYATDKRNRQYEDIKESCLKSGKSEAECKELAARTVNKQRAEHGETKSSVKTADNPLPQDDHIKAPEDVDTLREDKICPICGSNYDGHTCEVCGYVEPPDGLNNPDLEKAHADNPEQEGADGTEQSEEEDKVTELPNSEKGIPDDLGSDSPGQSYLKARNKDVTSSVINEMAWKASGYLESKRINKGERPLLAGNPPQSNEPAESIIKDPLKPTTTRTAESFVAAAGATNQENNMANENRVAADAPAGTAADKRVDVTGVGGVIQDTNEQASKPQGPHGEPGVTVDVEGKGGVYEDSNAESARPSEGTVDVEKEVRTDDSGPTKTWDNSNEPESAVTHNAPTWVTDNKWSAAQGVKPLGGEDVQPQKRVDLEQNGPTPDPIPGTQQWTGTDGNGVTKQQPPVTNVPTQFGGINSHVVAVFKLADVEVDMGIIEKSQKWERIAQLENSSEGEVVAQLASLERVRTAGLKKNHEPVVGKIPSLRQASVEETKTASLDSELDSALFSR